MKKPDLVHGPVRGSVRGPVRLLVLTLLQAANQRPVKLINEINIYD